MDTPTSAPLQRSRRGAAPQWFHDEYNIVHSLIIDGVSRYVSVL
jgi:hypothetical protein